MNIDQAAHLEERSNSFFDEDILNHDIMADFPQLNTDPKIEGSKISSK